MLSASWDTRRVGLAESGDADQADSNFAATLLVMPGHDLHQPLQGITSAYDVLAQTLDSEEQREERAGTAAANDIVQAIELLQSRHRA